MSRKFVISCESTLRIVAPLLVFGASAAPAVPNAWSLLGDDRGDGRYVREDWDLIAALHDTQGREIVAHCTRMSDEVWDHQITVERWDEATQSWLPLGQAFGGGEDGANAPSLALAGDWLYVAYIQRNSGTGVWGELKVKRYDEPGDLWVEIGQSVLNVDPLENAWAPSLVAVDQAGIDVAVAWEEDGGSAVKAWVKALRDDQWLLLGGGPLNVAPNRDAEDVELAFDGDRIVATWSEEHNDHQAIHVKAVGSDNRWTALGDDLAPGQYGHKPSIAFDGAALHVAYGSYDEALGNARLVLVKRWTDSAWQLLGGPLNEYSSSDDTWASCHRIALRGGRLWVAWCESQGSGKAADLFVKSYSGCEWAIDPGSRARRSLDVDPELDVGQLALAGGLASLLVGFVEEGAIYVERRDPGPPVECIGADRSAPARAVAGGPMW